LKIEFVQISDIHVGSESCPRVVERLRSAVSWINEELDPQFALVTGDMGEMGLKEELESAKDALDALEIPFRVLCGNHDGVEEGVFTEVFGDRLFRIDADSARFLCVGTGAGLYGDIGDEEVEWLAGELKKAGDTPCVLATHHALTLQGSGHMMPLAERERVLEVLRQRGNVHLVLSGHEHDFSISKRDGIWFVVAPAFVDEPHGFLHIELSSTIVEVQLYECDPETDRFTPSQRFSLSVRISGENT